MQYPFRSRSPVCILLMLTSVVLHAFMVDVPLCLADGVTLAQLNDPANRPAVVLPKGVEVPRELDDPDSWQRWIEHEAQARRLTLGSEYRDIARVFREQARILRTQTVDGQGVFWPAVLVQAAHETKFFQYNGDVPPRITPEGMRLPQGVVGGVPTYNFTGIGVTAAEVKKSKEENRTPGEFFGTKEQGVLASLQHFGIYGGVEFIDPQRSLVAKRTKLVQGFIRERAKGLVAKRIHENIPSPEIRIADLGAEPEYSPGDRVNFRPGATIESLVGQLEIDPSAKDWTVVGMERRDGAVVLEVQSKDGLTGFVNRGELEIPGNFVGFRRGSMTYAGDYDYGGKLVTHWIAAVEYVKAESGRRATEAVPAAADLATQVELTPPSVPAERIASPPAAAPPAAIPPKPDLSDLAKQVELVPPARKPVAEMPDTPTVPEERIAPRDRQVSPATPAGPAPREVEPFYAVYAVHPLELPRLPELPAGLRAERVMEWVAARIAERSAKDVTIAARPQGKIAFRVEGEMLEEYVTHLRTAGREPFKYFRPGAYRQSVYLFHPEAGFVRLPPVCLSFVGTMKELTDDIKGAISYPYTIPPQAGTLTGRRSRVNWSVQLLNEGRIEADPPTADRSPGRNWPTARQEAFESWQRIVYLTYFGLAQ